MKWGLRLLAALLAVVMIQVADMLKSPVGALPASLGALYAPAEYTPVLDDSAAPLETGIYINGIHKPEIEIQIQRETPLLPLEQTVQALGGLVARNGDGAAVIVLPDRRICQHEITTERYGMDGQEAVSDPSQVIGEMIYVTPSALGIILGARIDDGPKIEINVIYPQTAAGFDALAALIGRPYCLADNISRYLVYWEAHRELPMDQCMAFVNVNLDHDFFSDIVEIGTPDSILALCNKNYGLPAEYVPSNLTVVRDGGGRLTMRAETAGAFLDMKAAMAAEGLTVIPRSAYRGYAAQKVRYDEYVRRETRRLGSRDAGVAEADRFSARPGLSEHQTGLAIDMTQKNDSDNLYAEHFEASEEYRWMLDNAWRFGFIPRYPDGYEWVTGYMYEPWHWRYVGAEAAARMKEEGIVTFEEYCGKYCVSERGEGNATD